MSTPAVNQIPPESRDRRQLWIALGVIVVTPLIAVIAWCIGYAPRGWVELDTRSIELMVQSAVFVSPFQLLALRVLPRRGQRLLGWIMSGVILCFYAWFWFFLARAVSHA